ncbi:dihydrodipicolinate synthase family protein [Halobacteria archaeon AArc-m2/3/4]|uniref:Dihydrodipicolinate synthase family protein n=1 Tax=Natronoglomus mannanivorans TaxID=2979990 RepID=A0ABT2QKK9_9EURY|nr:dihydrodipicolinate synthase family protein [Halobacteria archaeon AArc-m2/3/4]
MTMPDKPGDCPIIATPFTPDGAIDYPSLENELRIIAEYGCEAATLFGVASEFFKLSDDERVELAKFVADVCADVGVSLVVSVTHESTVVAVERAKQYEAIGADCIMVFPPRFMDPPAEAVVEHVRRIGEAVSVPVMVQHTDVNVDISPATFAALNEAVPNVRYFKIEVSEPGAYISALLEETDGRVGTLVGNWGFRMIDAYDRGAVGVMPIVLYDELYLEIHDRYVRGDREGAVELHNELLSALNYVQDIPAAKRLLAEQGIIDSPHCREPASDIGDDVDERHIAEAHERMTALIDSI